MEKPNVFASPKKQSLAELLSSAEAQAFYAAIREEPEDVGRSLIFADWLEERGELNRAELIRIEHQLDSIPEWDKSRKSIDALVHSPSLKNLKMININKHSVRQSAARESQLRERFGDGFILNSSRFQPDYRYQWKSWSGQTT